jgi:type VI secretion system secreted protein Hcp
MYITAQGQKQGTFKGDDAGKDKGRIALTAFAMDVLSPRDASSGLPSGKRQYKPIMVRKEIGASSPQFLQAMATNEVLTSVLIEFLSSNAAGLATLDYRVELTNAIVSEFKQSIDTAAAGGPPIDTRRLEEIQFVFQRITASDPPGKTAFSDDWTLVP